MGNLEGLIQMCVESLQLHVGIASEVLNGVVKCSAMESAHHVSVPLRAGKKMKKRKELDALFAHSVGKRACNSNGVVAASATKRPAGGVSSQDQLLSESTDEQEEYWATGGKADRPRVRMLLRRRACGALLRACTAVLVFACVMATVTVMWLFIDIREQVTSLRTELDQVVAGNQDVPEALQKCHSLSKDLQQNQTALFNHLEALTLQLRNFSAQLTVVQYGLRDMEERLKAAPELVNMPRDLHALSSSVASFGSQIGDLNATVSALKAQNNQLQETSKSLIQNITSVKQSVSQLLTVSQQPQDTSKQRDEEKEAVLSIMAHISQNVSLVNDTLTKKLQWVSDDQKTDHKAIDTLRELSQNVSARVTTLEGECTKSSAQAALMSTVNNITEKVGSNEGQLHDLNTRVLQLQNQYSQLESNGSQLTVAVNDVRQAVTKLKEQYSPILRVQPSNKEPSKPSPDVPAT